MGRHARLIRQRSVNEAGCVVQTAHLPFWLCEHVAVLQHACWSERPKSEAAYAEYLSSGLVAHLQVKSLLRRAFLTLDRMGKAFLRQPRQHLKLVDRERDR